MEEILVLDKRWILEELTAGKKIIPPPRPDCLQCYWMVRPSQQNMPLVVCVNDLPNCSGDQVYRLSLLADVENKSKSDSPSTPSSPSLVPLHESPDVGTSILYEDECVKIWEFRLPPGERCVYHRYRKPYFFLNLTPSCNQELDYRGRAVSNQLPSRQKTGQCTYVPREKLSAHAVRNVGDEIFLQFIVEFQD